MGAFSSLTVTASCAQFTTLTSFHVNAVQTPCENMTVPCNASIGYATFSLPFEGNLYLVSENYQSGVYWVVPCDTFGPSNLCHFVIDSGADTFAQAGVINSTWNPDKVIVLSQSNLPIPVDVSFRLYLSSLTTPQTITPAQISTISFKHNANVSFAAAGYSDSTAPTCTSSGFSALSFEFTFYFNKTNESLDRQDAPSLQISCKDNEGGSGVAYVGAIMQIQTASYREYFLGAISSYIEGVDLGNFQFPAYLNSQVTLAGFYVVDFVGNAAVYGSCGDLQIDSLCVPHDVPPAVSGTMAAAARVSMLTLLVCFVCSLLVSHYPLLK